MYIKRDSVSAMTSYERRRLVLDSQRCTFCGHLIFNNEPIIVEKNRVGKRAIYNFYHLICYQENEGRLVD